MVSSHKEYTSKVLSAIKSGQDPMSVVDENRDHLVECARCRENVIRMAKDLLGVDLSFIEELLTSQAETELTVPERIPNPDFTFSGRRIFEVADPVQFHLKLPRSQTQFKDFRSDQLASIVLSEPVPDKIEQIHQVVTLPGGAGLIMDVEARFLPEGFTELGITFLENKKGYSTVTVRLAGEGDERSTSGPLAGRLAIRPLNPGVFDLQISVLGPAQVPVLVWRLKIILQVSFYLDLKNNRKATKS